MPFLSNFIIFYGSYCMWYISALRYIIFYIKPFNWPCWIGFYKYISLAIRPFLKPYLQLPLNHLRSWDCDLHHHVKSTITQSETAWTIVEIWCTYKSKIIFTQAGKLHMKAEKKSLCPLSFNTSVIWSFNTLKSESRTNQQSVSTNVWFSKFIYGP